VLEIRECAADDLDLLERLMPTPGHDAHTQHFTHQQAGGRTYLVAWHQAVPVGTCLIMWDGSYAGSFAPEVHTALPDAVEISNVHVLPDARGRGVGTALITAAEARIVTRGCRAVMLGVGVDNPRAADLYVSLGYRDTGLVFTACYTYRGDDGVDRQAVEHSRVLAKMVGDGHPVDSGA
jgi:ribosomal protein S18 acetylase RimI-like enzyme